VQRIAFSSAQIRCPIPFSANPAVRVEKHYTLTRV
jgi:hypothetical protein